MSAADSDPPGCPDLALWTAVMAALRTSFAIFINSNLFMSRYSNMKMLSILKYSFVVSLEFLDFLRLLMDVLSFAR